MKKVLFIYYIFATIIFAGFASHGSDTPEIFIFSIKYLAVLVVMALLLFVAIPWWINRFGKKKWGKKFFHGVGSIFDHVVCRLPWRTLLLLCNAGTFV